MMLLFRISVQLSVEPLIAHVTSSTLEQLQVSFTGRIQLDCYCQCELCNRTWLKFRRAFCVF